MVSSRIDQISSLGPLPLEIDNDRANEIIKQVIQECADKLELVQRSLLENPLPTLARPSARKELASYVVQTDPQDFPLLMDSDYLKKYKDGLMPPPVSPYWLNLLTLPVLFELVVARFRRLRNQKLPDNLSDDTI